MVTNFVVGDSSIFIGKDIKKFSCRLYIFLCITWCGYNWDSIESKMTFTKGDKMNIYLTN